MLIDFHTHAFPEKIAAKAIAKLGRDSGLFPHTDGTAASLRALMRRDGVDMSVVLPIATNPATQAHTNDHALESAGDGLIVFGSVHPDAPDVLEELERLKSLGVKGIKFHPDYQGFFADDEKMRPIYRKISELGLITVFHTGADYGFRPPYHCPAERLARAVKWFDAPVVAAHWGGVDDAAEAIRCLPHADIMNIDTSFGYGTNIRQFAMDLIEHFGPEHVLFGSDAPWHPPVWELRLFETLPLSGDIRDMIFCQNALRLLGIAGPED